MTTPSLTYKQLQLLDLRPREGRMTWLSAAKAGAGFDSLLLVAVALSRTDKDVERRLRLFLADCAARDLHIFEKARPGDDRPRKAIIAARQFARGEIDDAARGAARSAADSAARSVAWSPAWSPAWSAAESAARGAPESAARSAAGKAEEQWQRERLVARMSAKEPGDWPLPEPAEEKEAA